MVVTEITRGEREKVQWWAMVRKLETINLSSSLSIQDESGVNKTGDKGCHNQILSCTVDFNCDTCTKGKVDRL